MIILGKCVIALCGLPLSGKTSLGHALAGRTNLTFLDVDAARRQIEPGTGWHGPNSEYGIMRRAYGHNHALAEDYLRAGCGVILAATYSRPEYCEALRQLAVRNNGQLSFFRLVVPDATVVDRLERRNHEGADSNITSIDRYLPIKQRYQAPPECIVFDGGLPLEELVEMVLASLPSSAIA